MLHLLKGKSKMRRESKKRSYFEVCDKLDAYLAEEGGDNANAPGIAPGGGSMIMGKKRPWEEMSE